MRKMVFTLLQEPIKTVIMAWGAFSLLQLVWFYYFPTDENPIFLDSCILVAGIYGSCFQMGMMGSFSFLRSFTKSIRQFWMLRLVCLLILTALNLAIFYLKNYIQLASLFSGYSLVIIYALSWLAPCSIILSFLVSSKLGFQQQITMRMKPGAALLHIFFLYACLGLIVYVGYHSPIAAIFSFTFGLWSYFMFFDEHVRNSLYPRLQRKIWLGGTTYLLIFLTINVAFFYKPNRYNTFLGALGPEKVRTNFSSFEKIMSIDDFLVWYEDLNTTISADEAILVAKRLEELCPVQYNDRPLEIKCLTKKRTARVNFLDQNWSAEDLEKFLKSAYLGTRLVGLVKVRAFSYPLNKNFEELVRKLTSIPGQISTVALATLYGKKINRNILVSIDPISEKEIIPERK